MEKPFLLFEVHQYYPAGGLYDAKGAYATLDECVAEMEAGRADDWHVLDMRTGTVIHIDTKDQFSESLDEFFKRQRP